MHSYLKFICRSFCVIKNKTPEAISFFSPKVTFAFEPKKTTKGPTLESAQYAKILSELSNGYKYSYEKLESLITEKIGSLSSYQLDDLIEKFYKLKQFPSNVWENILKIYLKLPKETQSIISVQRITENCDDLSKYSEELKKVLANTKFREDILPAFLSISNGINDNELLSLFINQFNLSINRMSLKSVISTTFILSKQQKLGSETLDQVAEYLKNVKNFENPLILTKAFMIFTRENSFYEFLNPIFYNQLLILQGSFNTRNLINIIHSFLGNASYAYPPSLEFLYNELAENSNLKPNPIDYSSLLHALSKFHLSAGPFLKYCNEDLLSQCNGNQVGIIFHNIKSIADENTIVLLKKNILEKIGEINPKQVLNIAKDISEIKTKDAEFWEQFEPKALQIIQNHHTKESDEFITQLNSIIVNNKKHSYGQNKK